MEEEKDDLVAMSNCCGVEMSGDFTDIMICPACKEHCCLIDENGNDIQE